MILIPYLCKQMADLHISHVHHNDLLTPMLTPVHACHTWVIWNNHDLGENLFDILA